MSQTVSFRLLSFRWLGPKLWAFIPSAFESVKSLDALQNKLRELSFGKIL